MVFDNPELVLYHGTAADAAERIRRDGIRVDAGRLELDFGRGFYLTSNRQQAATWAFRKCRPHFGEARLLAFTVPLDDIAAAESLIFVRGATKARDYWRFVTHCRGGGNHQRAGRSIWYDLVAGPVTRWPVQETLEDSDQFSIHTDRMARMFDRYLRSATEIASRDRGGES